jgi:signal transduction histidine kinase
VKLVAKYTLVLVTALGLAIAVLGYFHVQRNQRHFEDDMRTDHVVVGHVLQSLLANIWLDTPDHGEARVADVLDLANAGGGDARFEWVAGSRSAEHQGIEGHEFVSRFPVRVRDRLIGSLIVREALDDNERQLRDDLIYTAGSFAVIVLLCLAASLTLGRWLVGKPIALLVQKARRVAKRDFAGAVELRRRDELGELAEEMNAMSDALARALERIASETEARVRAVEQLRHAERLATVGRLAAGLAHEMGTPLAIVGGHAQMISGGEVAGNAVLASAQAIDRETARMGRIVRQLLDFARRSSPRAGACAVAETAKRCVALLAPMTDARRVDATVDAPPVGVQARIDEDSLQHVLTNLLVNAVQAMADGGALALRVTRARARRRPDDAERECVRIDVSDTGPGIAPEVLPHVFEPFFTTKQPGEGTGLGLAVVYGIVDDHGGWLDVATSPQGSTFSVFLEELVT